jgi:hypothetical protein
MTRKARITVRIGTIGVVVLAVAIILWVRRFHHYTPIEVVRDLQAGIAARNAPRPVERFLELRYGSLTEPANREKAFLDFFNVGHIEGLQILVRRAPESRRPVAIAAMAQWVADYRQNMTAEEKESLRSYLGTPAGRTTIQEATAKYLSQDVHYRAATAPVIRELMTTLAEVQKH